jgi:hypothetical protein
MHHIRTEGDRHHVIVAKLGQLAITQQIEAYIAGRHQIRGSATHDQRRKGRSHLLQFGIDAADLMQPAVYGLKRARSGHAGLQSVGEPVVGIDKGPHREFGRHPPALAAAHAIGQSDHAATRNARGEIAEHHTDVVLVDVMLPASAGRARETTATAGRFPGRPFRGG